MFRKARTRRHREVLGRRRGGDSDQDPISVHRVRQNYVVPKVTRYRRPSLTVWDNNSYLDDEEATNAAFTSDGFYKTGDNARRVGDEYVIEGRATTDCE